MKRFLILGVFAIATATASIQEASAWINSNFGVGMNWGFQCGGNDFLCGLCRCGQPGAPDYYKQQVPVYPRPTCCTAPAPVMPPQTICPPGAGGHGLAAPGYPGPVQAFRPAYQPVGQYYYGR